MADRTVLVTGAATAVGRATALSFREQGWTVYAAAPDEDDLSTLADHGCETDSLDVTVETDVRRVVKRVATEEGGIDCLVTNPGLDTFGPLEETPVEDARRGFDETVFGFHRLVRRVLPHMREAGEGTIVAVSSVLGRVSGPGTGVHSGAKAALEAMSDSLRTEVGGDGVEVVVVEPALVDADVQAAAEADLDGETDYEWVRDLLADVAAVSEGGPLSVPPDRVAATVVDAACATAPAPRYPVGRFAELLVYARYLPDDWRDLLFRFVRRVA